MKKYIKILLPLVSLPLSVMVFSSLYNLGEVKKASGYSASSLPTTIDLNDSTASEIRTYYSSLNGLSTSERQGNNLLKNLKTILKNGQKYFSYDSGSTVWEMYEITDRDWVKSPASSTTYGTYNSSENKITNYQYGSGKNNPYIHALYINRNVTNQTKAWGNHNQDEWGINREHVWPKAEGFDGSGQGGARGDPMHLMAGNGWSNNIHSNYYYGYVKTTSSYTDCGDKYSNQRGNLRGTSLTLNSGTVFEPQDCDKGDIARAIFYMVARYNYLSGSDSDGINNNNPNLELTQNLSDWASSGYTSSTSRTGKMGILTDLLAWHHADPVDQYEIHRNNLLYKNFTNNRNPFIDFPEWVDFIWGTANYSGKYYQSYSSTPTGVATPSSDTINGYNDGGEPPEIINVTGVTLNKNATSLEVGATETLTATVSPSDANDKSVSWSSSDNTVVTVNSNGLVTAVAAGSATITVTTNDGDFTASCVVSVTSSGGGGGGGGSGDSETVSVSIGTYASEHSWSNDTKYTSINLDEVVAASVSVGGGNTGKYYTNGYNWRFYQNESAAITITAASGYEIESVTFTYSTDKSGTLLDADDDVVLSGSAYTVDGSSATFYVGNSGTGSNGQVRFTAISVTYHATGASLSSITLDTSNVTTSFTVGDTFNSDGLIVTAHYSDNSTKTVVPTSISSPDMSVAGEKTITVTYNSKTATYEITVNEPAPTAIYVSCSYLYYYVGETIIKDDLSVENDLGEEIGDFSFEPYTFTYEDAPEDEGDGSIKTLEVSYEDPTYGHFETEFEVYVRRKLADIEIVTDVITSDVTGIKTNYTSFSGKSASSNAIYAGYCAGSNTYIQLRSKQFDSGDYSGIVTTSSAGIGMPVAKITVEWDSSTYNGRTIEIYGKNTSYASANDLFSDNSSTQGTYLGSIVCGTSTTLYINSNDYSYFGLKSKTNALYVNSISITYGRVSAEQLSEYIMYSDTENQCVTKLDTVIGYFDYMTLSEKELFMTSNEEFYVTARNRLEAWATNQGKQIIVSNGDYTFTNKSANELIAFEGSDTGMITILIVTTSIAFISGIIIFARRKKNGLRIL